MQSPFFSIGTCHYLLCGGMQFFVKDDTGTRMEIGMAASASVLDLKVRLWAMTGRPSSRMRLIFAAEHNLEDARTLQDYHIQSQSTLHLAEAPLELRSGRVVSHVYFANKRRRLCEKFDRIAISERVSFGCAFPGDEAQEDPSSESTSYEPAPGETPLMPG